MSKTILKGHIQVSDEDLTAVLAALPAHIEATKKEAGCITFQVEQDQQNKNKLSVYEEYVDDDAFTAHQQRTKNSPWWKITEHVERHYEITRSRQYGDGDCSYQTAGQLPGLTALVDLFFDLMDSLPEAKIVRRLYPTNLTASRQKLTYFLSGWLGGPKIYQQHYGPINIPSAHRHLAIDEKVSAAWIGCMEKAVAQQNYDEGFKSYLIQQLCVPADRIVSVCSRTELNQVASRGKL